MTHGRKPRKPRYISANPLRLARNAATKLAPAEIAVAINPIREAARLTREGVATETDWSLLASLSGLAEM